jgi:hypothetical protein
MEYKALKSVVGLKVLIVFVQFIVDENGTKGDVRGLVSSGGPHIFCDK